MHGVGLIERAFELARSGKYISLAEIRLRLNQEGYVTSHLQGRFLAFQLRKLMKGAHSKPPVDGRDGPPEFTFSIRGALQCEGALQCGAEEREHLDGAITGLQLALNHDKRVSK